MSLTIAFGSRSLVALCGLLVVSCAAEPDLQLVGEEKQAMSAAEGRQLLHRGRAAEAVTAFRQSLRRDGPNLHSLNGLAIAYSELGRPDLATEMFARALRLAPNDPATLNNIGFSALRRAMPALARHYLEKAKGRDSNLQEVQGNLQRLALLEANDLRPLLKPGRTQSPLFSPERRSASFVHLSSLKDAKRPASKDRVSESRSWPTSPDFMMDFTAVVDPFVDHRNDK